MIYPLTVFMAMVAWCFLHSWLAAFSTKRLARQLFGEGIERYYRLIYIVIALLTLMPILAMVLLLPGRLLWTIPPPWVYLTSALQLLALAGLFISILQIDALAFLGIRQLTNPDAERDAELVTHGTYGLVRHPLYLFSIILFWLIPFMTDLILSFVIASTLYFIIGTFPEERKLVDIYGEDYEAYQEDVPRIIPFINLS